MADVFCMLSCAGELGEEEVSEELAAKLGTEPSDPPMDLEQLCALKAELRNLVPGIHEALLSPSLFKTLLYGLVLSCFFLFFSPSHNSPHCVIFISPSSLTLAFIDAKISNDSPP
jgi:hypothetical protein